MLYKDRKLFVRRVNCMGRELTKWQRNTPYEKRVYCGRRDHIFRDEYKVWNKNQTMWEYGTFCGLRVHFAGGE